METFMCDCEEGHVLRKISKNINSRGDAYFICPKSQPKAKVDEMKWGCGGFCWEKDRIQKITTCGESSSPGPSSVPGSSPVPSPTRPSSSQEKCLGCRYYSFRVKVLEKQLELASRLIPNASEAAAELHEFLNELTFGDQ